MCFNCFNHWFYGCGCGRRFNRCCEERCCERRCNRCCEDRCERRFECCGDDYKHHNCYDQMPLQTEMPMHHNHFVDTLPATCCKQPVLDGCEPCNTTLGCPGSACGCLESPARCFDYNISVVNNFDICPACNEADTTNDEDFDNDCHCGC